MKECQRYALGKDPAPCRNQAGPIPHLAAADKDRKKKSFSAPNSVNRRGIATSPPACFLSSMLIKMASVWLEV